MIKLLYFNIIVVLISTYSYSQSYKYLKKGAWSAYLQLNNSTKLPFHLEISGSKQQPVFTIHNAEEKIELSSIKIINDSLQIDFPHFHSFIRFVVINKTEISGAWTNLNKGDNYRIPFGANLNLKKNICSQQKLLNLSGKWKTTFSPKTEYEEFAVGVFRTEDYSQKITGTFLTESGDYRFLEGFVCDDFMELAAFDGSHAFYFSGKLINGEIQGEFFSGKHYQKNWTANRDEIFKLRNPDSLTFLVKKDTFAFKLKDLEGKEFLFPNEQFKNKITIVQIMGTWCPNCLDETKFLKEMYTKYHQAGLEIISVAYETPSIFEEQVQKVKLLKTRLNLDFTFLIGGQANKALASEQFSMLNQITSYPTTIFLDKNGQVTKIHTGFNGPGTGKVYTDFIKETEDFLKELLK